MRSAAGQRGQYQLDHIDVALRGLQQRMADLQAAVTRTDADVRSVRDEVVKVQVSLDRVEADLYRIAEADRNQELWQTINFALGYRERSARGLALPGVELQRAEATFFTFATSTAADEVAEPSAAARMRSTTSSRSSTACRWRATSTSSGSSPSRPDGRASPRRSPRTRWRTHATGRLPPAPTPSCSRRTRGGSRAPNLAGSRGSSTRAASSSGSSRASGRGMRARGRKLAVRRPPRSLSLGRFGLGDAPAPDSLLAAIGDTQREYLAPLTGPTPDVIYGEKLPILSDMPLRFDPRAVPRRAARSRTASRRRSVARRAPGSIPRARCRSRAVRLPRTLLPAEQEHPCPARTVRAAAGGPSRARSRTGPGTQLLGAPTTRVRSFRWAFPPGKAGSSGSTSSGSGSRQEPRRRAT